MNLYIILITVIGISLALSGCRLLKYILSAKKEHTLIVSGKIKEWYELIKDEKHIKKIPALEKEIDKLFENKVLKTALLHFSDKFIEQYFMHINFKCEPDRLQAEFEKMSGISLNKSRQSLKILSLTYGHNFTIANYSYLNYWYIIRGNYRMYDGGKTDSEGKTYTWDDVEKPFKVLEYYFKYKL